MAWYLRNTTATRFGASRRCLDSTDATASANFAFANDSVLQVVLYTVTSAGVATSRAAGSYTLDDLAKSARPITLGNIAADIDIPDGGGVMLQVGPSTTDRWFTPVESGHVLKAGSHQVTVTFESAFNGDNENFDVVVYYGAQQSFGPDNIFYTAPAGTPPTITTHPSNATDRTFAQSTSFTAGASGDPAPTVQWQRLKPSGTWTNIIGATSDTLTISAAGHNFQYRAVYTNSAGTATSNAATLTMSTASPDMVGGTYPAEVISDYLTYRGATAIVVLGNVAATDAVVNFDNPDLDLSGAFSGETKVGQLEAPGFRIGRLKNITDLAYIRSTGTQNFQANDCIRFPGATDFSGITTPAITGTKLDGIIQFGDSQAISATLAKRQRVNANGLTIDDCELTAGIIGGVDGITFLNCFGTVDSRGNVYKSIQIGGKDIHVWGCTFEAQNAECLFKVAANWGVGISTTGLDVQGCTFTGGHEEMLGMDDPGQGLYGHVTAKSATTVTIAVDTNVLNQVDPLVGTTAQVDRHLCLVSGAAHGNYHLITAQADAVLTLDTSTWGTGSISVDDRVMVVSGMVESLWYGNHVNMKRGFRDRGYGCNVGFSIHGNCYGNVISTNDFHLAEPLALPVGDTPIVMPGRGSAPQGPVIAASSYAVAINETGVCFSVADWEHSAINSRNVYEDNTADADIPVFMSAQTLCYSGESPEALRPIGYLTANEDYSFGIVVRNNIYDAGAVCEVQDVKSITWTGNTTAAPTTTYTGRTPHDYTAAPSVVWPYTQRAAYDALNTAEWKWYDQPDYLWEYHLTLDAESGTTWGAPLDPSGVTLAADGTATWTDNANNETGQRIRWTVNGTTGDPADLAADIETASYGSLAGVTSLYCEVQAYNATGDSAWIASNTVTFSTGRRRQRMAALGGF